MHLNSREHHPKIVLGQQKSLRSAQECRQCKAYWRQILSWLGRCKDVHRSMEPESDHCTTLVRLCQSGSASAEVGEG